jgi:hypothetical protein
MTDSGLLMNSAWVDSSSSKTGESAAHAALARAARARLRIVTTPQCHLFRWLIYLVQLYSAAVS